LHAGIIAQWLFVTAAIGKDGSTLRSCVYDLDLLVENLPGEAVDRHMHPVMLFPFEA
jgi:hypothetical protein